MCLYTLSNGKNICKYVYENLLKRVGSLEPQNSSLLLDSLGFSWNYLEFAWNYLEFAWNLLGVTWNLLGWEWVGADGLSQV